MKKKKSIALSLAVALLFSAVPVFAETGENGIQVESVTITDESNMQTEEVIITDENRYDPVYYQEPEERYPQSSAGTRSVRSVSLSLEDYVVSELEQLPDEIDVSAYQIPTEEKGTPFFQILNNHPELFYVQKSVSYSFGNDGYIHKYFIEYQIPKDDIPEYRKKLEEEVDLAVAQVDSSMSDVEKALTVHDYLALHCEYDYDRLNNNTLPEISHSVYGSLVERMAVCDGYASAFSYIMKDRFGIPCIIVSSNSMNHAWNMIEIDGEWYHVDVTWDDPVWDSIGRVTHNYFLLSDSLISDSVHTHEGWSSDNTADSAAYDNAFWTDITSAIIYNQGEWFYSQYDSSANKVNLVKKDGLFGNSEVAVYAGDVWGTATSFWEGSYMYLDKANGNLYFNTKSDIRRLNNDGTTDIVYQPTVPTNQCIYGFTIRGNQLCYAIQDIPDLTSKQSVQTYMLEELGPLEIKGIYAENVQAVYDGTAKIITVTGTQANDRVYYALENSTEYSESQPIMVDAGTYQVSYRVERSGYPAYIGKATVTIEQGTPEYTMPTGLKGNSGETLASIKLPEGFVWQTQNSTKLFTEGTFTYLVKYVPEDAKNYKEVSGISVQVTVSCPGHRYKSVISKNPTTVQKGLKTYTCEVCGRTYTEEIAMLVPQKPGNVSGQKVSKATASSLKFTWNKVSGVSYELVFYKGKSKVSTKDVSGSSVTFSKLKAATEYSLKITPFKKIDGRKVYAAKSATVVAATAPAKVKLSSLKKSGNRKAKLTWKKVTGASGYEVYMKTGKGKYSRVKTYTQGKNISYTKSGLKKGKTYSFRVRAYKKVGKTKVYGSYSSAKSLKIK